MNRNEFMNNVCDVQVTVERARQIVNVISENYLSEHPKVVNPHLLALHYDRLQALNDAVLTYLLDAEGALKRLVSVDDFGWGTSDD